ncbi:PAS domain S-box protein [Leptospira sp. GIMC2001]|nr:PAS domain S-box protein [Leptospira sp. GIMC2001]WCL49046.1 PAS domain S-box protein [Leptospira sp. GIMC2001]
MTMISSEEKTILLVEDEAILAMMQKGQLEKEGYKVYHALNGEKALSIITSGDPNFDLILMDIDLGKGLDGTQTAVEILKNHLIPIVFLSSHTEKEVVQKTETITSYGYVVKNSGITVLDASIKMAFKLFEANEITKSKKEHLEIVLRSIGDAVIATDKESKVMHMNVVAEILTGWKFSEVQGRKLNEFFIITDSETGRPILNPVDKVLETDQVVGLANHTILTAKNGSNFQIADSGSPIKDLKGNTQGVVLVFRDVTQEYLVQSKIAEQAEMLDNVADAIIAKDKNFVIKFWNKAAEKIYGWKSEEVIGKVVTDVLESEYIGTNRNQVIENLMNDGRYSADIIQKRKDGTLINIETNAIKQNDRNGNFIGIISVNRDVTEKMHNLQALKDSEMRLIETIESAMDAIISIDKNKEIILFNEAAERMFGHKSADIFGKKLDLLIPMDFRNQHDTHIDTFAKTGTSRRAMGELGQIKGLRANGEQFPIEASISQINLNGEKIFTVILRDVTIRNTSENKIKKLLSEKDNFLKEIHHRVKNNMNVIFTLLTLQSDSQSDPAVKSLLNDAAGRVKSMIVLYDKLYESDSNNTVSIHEYFPSLFQEILSIFPNSIKLDLNIDKSIVLNARLLSSIGIIINELITNSIKHGFKPNQESKIYFSVSQTNDKVLITYRDNGVGIPEQNSMDKAKGFGLQLISMLVEQINGSIRYENSDGANFFIEFTLER